jgi:hypothetical protein
LWVPSYFCFDVSQYWKRHVEVSTYSDDPRHPQPEWPTLQPSPSDLVVAVNYFGIRDGGPWRNWREQNECLLVEDHSHDPLSGWALHSNAHYAFASLRKTIPVPDGAILWSPCGLSLPTGGTSESPASSLKLAAMLWKRDYLAGNLTSAAKAVYLRWQRQGEECFDGSEVCFATSLSREYLSFGFPLSWRKRRVANTRRILSLVRNNTAMRPIFSRWPTDAAPLGAVFEFESRALRDTMRDRLRENDVYCPVHWPPNAECDPAARDLAERLLTIPTDHRYGAREMEKIASLVAI